MISESTSHERQLERNSAPAVSAIRRFLKKNIFYFYYFFILRLGVLKQKISGIIGLKRFHILSLSRRLLVKKVDSVLSRATRLVTAACVTGVKETPRNQIHASAALA